MNDEVSRERHRRRARIAQRGPVAIALVDDGWPAGPYAIVRLNQRAPRPRYIIAPREGFDDSVILRARLAAMSYEMEHESDSAPVQLTLYHDRIDILAARDGPRTVRSRIEGSHAHPERHSGAMLAAFETTDPVAIDGFPSARFVSETETLDRRSTSA